MKGSQRHLQLTAPTVSGQGPEEKAKQLEKLEKEIGQGTEETRFKYLTNRMHYSKPCRLKYGTIDWFPEKMARRTPKYLRLQKFWLSSYRKKAE